MTSQTMSLPAAGAVLYAADFRRLAAFYGALLDTAPLHADDEYALFRFGDFEFVIMTTAESRATAAGGGAVPDARIDAAIKPVFFVASLDAARARTTALGGDVRPVKNWRFNGCVLCDAIDPEGNVFQLRQLVEHP